MSDSTNCRSIDVTPFVCPTTFVKVSLELEEMAPGELLRVLIRKGESLENVRRTAKSEGAILVGETPVGQGIVELILRRGLS